MNKGISQWQDGGAAWLSLFASACTLICCALPMLLVALGLGATVAALASTFPILIALSQNKIWVFGISGLMLALSAWLLYRPGRRCPIDPVVATRCATALAWSRRIFFSAALVWGIGFFSAFLALPLRVVLEDLLHALP